jgi:hypothetical protein
MRTNKIQLYSPLKISTEHLKSSGHCRFKQFSSKGMGNSFGSRTQNQQLKASVEEFK